VWDDEPGRPVWRGIDGVPVAGDSLRGNICHGNESLTWCREANVAGNADIPKSKNQNAH
jgi:hypothetical protein